MMPNTVCLLFFLSIFTKDFSLEYTKDFCQCVWFLYQGNTGLMDTQRSESHSVVSDSLQPRGLYSPWNSPDQSTGVGSLSLLQGIFPTQGLNPGLPHHRQILYPLRDGKASAYNAGDPGSISLGWEDPLEKGMATHSSTLPCLENPMDGAAWWATVHESQRIGHQWATSLHWYWSHRISWEVVSLPMFLKYIFFVEDWHHLLKYLWRHVELMNDFLVKKLLIFECSVFSF